MTSILVIVERNDETRQTLTKACVLARHFGAQLELFMCDAEHAYAINHSYDVQGIEEARRQCLADARGYLEALRQTVAAEDVRIAIDVACESPLYEGVVQKVLRSCPDLVMLSGSLGNNGTLGHAAPGRGLTPTAWQVIRTCPIPVMLTQGRAWQPQPRFAAAVDVSQQESPGLAHAIVQTSEYLARGCNGRFDIFFCEQDEPRANDTATQHAAALEELARNFAVPDDRVHLLSGEPMTTLPQFASRQAYDLLVLGALSHRKALAALVGTLTGKLVDLLACDFILVKPGTYACPIPRRPLSARAV